MQVNSTVPEVFRRDEDTETHTLIQEILNQILFLSSHFIYCGKEVINEQF
jgi:hypothetical protein